MQTLYSDCPKRTGLVFLGLMLTLATISPVLAGPLVQFRTVFGDIEVELFDQDKPLTVQNFIRYVQSGRYRDTFIHRCNPTFVIQGGGYFVANRGGASPYLDAIPTSAPIPNEFGVGKRYSNAYGTIAMAKLSGNTNSATSQWFFNLADNTFLDAADSNSFFTVFGKVVRGTNALNTFKTFSYLNPATNVLFDLRPYLLPWEHAGAFGEMPFLTTNYTYGDIIFTDISLLNVQVRLEASGARSILWNSVSGRTNQVQFTTNLPPIWNLLMATNGTGLPMQVQDTSTSAARRFYRVKVDY